MKTIAIFLLMSATAFAQQTICQNGVCRIVYPTKQVQAYVPPAPQTITVQPQVVQSQPRVVYSQPVPMQSVVVQQAAPTAAPCPRCGKYHGATATQSTQQYASGGGGALARLNQQRAARGLPPYRQSTNPALQAAATSKANIQASRSRMFHPGGSMGGGNREGVGMSHDGTFMACYAYASANAAAAATVRGRNGAYYHCLLLEGGSGPSGSGGNVARRRRIFRR